ncbi:lipid-A-disaccharide synthase [Candidatus Omnitrophota bacterium]
MSDKKNILIISGEPSGDMRAGELLKELKALLPNAAFWGVGGEHMEQEGTELIEHIRRLSMVGVWEVIKKLPRIREQYNTVIKNIRERKPDLAILVDYPGFNLRIAEALHRMNIPVIYYVIPQVWAWGRGRLKLLKQYVDMALVLFKFEEEFLSQAGIDCEFVGHPLVDASGALREGAVKTSGGEKFTIALLPGSRKSEILNMLPVMLDTAERIHKDRKDIRFVIAENSHLERALYDSALAGHEELALSRFTDDTFACLEKCDFAIVTSGTATLETAIMEKPMVITYRAAILTFILFRIFARIPFIGLVNIIAGKEVAPELLQGDATAEKLSEKVMDIIKDEARMNRMKDELRKVKHSLGEKGASRRAAEAVNRFVQTRGL